MDDSIPFLGAELAQYLKIAGLWDDRPTLRRRKMEALEPRATVPDDPPSSTLPQYIVY